MMIFKKPLNDANNYERLAGSIKFFSTAGIGIDEFLC